MKYAAFDIGNVLVNVDFNPVIYKLSKTLNITADESSYFIKRIQKSQDLGLTTMEEEFRDRLGIKSQFIIDELTVEWDKCIKPNKHVLRELNSMLDSTDLKIALLSNIGLEHASNMGTWLQEGGLKQEYIKHFSCHVGARKPSLIFFQSFLMQNPEFEGCLYVDDLQENLDIAKKVGFRVHRFSLDETVNYNLLMTELQDIFKSIFARGDLL